MKKIITTLAMALLSSSAVAATITPATGIVSDLKINSQPYASGMVLPAGKVTVSGVLAQAYRSRLGVFRTGSRSCTIPAGYLKASDFNSKWAAGCVPTFTALADKAFGWSIGMVADYNTGAFSVSLDVQAGDADIGFVTESLGPGWCTTIGPRRCSIGLLQDMEFTDYISPDAPVQQSFTGLTVLQPADRTQSDTLMNLAESKFPSFFPHTSTVYDVVYQGAIYHARAYSNGWILGVKNNGEFWYLTPEGTLGKYADSITEATTKLQAL